MNLQLTKIKFILQMTNKIRELCANNLEKTIK
jgi:hypothetical protein